MEKSRAKNEKGEKKATNVSGTFEEGREDHGKTRLSNASSSFDSETDFCDFAELMESQIVWAKIPGHASWPALVQSKSGDNGGIVVSWIEIRNGYFYASTADLIPNTEKLKKFKYFVRDFGPNFKKATTNKKQWTSTRARKSILIAVQMVCEQLNVKDCPEKEKDLWKFAQSETFQKLKKICISEEVYNRCLEGVKGWGFVTQSGIYRKRKTPCHPDPPQNGDLKKATPPPIMSGIDIVEVGMEMVRAEGGGMVDLEESGNGTGSDSEHPDDPRMIESTASANRNASFSGFAESGVEAMQIQGKKERKYKCEKCGARFSESHDLDQHKQNLKHQQTSGGGDVESVRFPRKRERQFKCEKCGARFSESYNFAEHKQNLKHQ